MSAKDGRIERAEVESALREMFGEGEATARQYAGRTIGAAGAFGFLALVAAFLFGRRRGRKRAAIVEIRRV